MFRKEQIFMTRGKKSEECIEMEKEKGWKDTLKNDI